MSDTTIMSSISDISNKTVGANLIYDTETVSNILGVQASTLRKYCALMQKNGYKFNKNNLGHRIFYQKDIEVIKEIVDLKNSGSLTLNEAIKTILHSDISDITDIEPITNPNYDKIAEQFEEFKSEQMQFNKTLLEQLEKQQDYIKNSINERDRKLMAALKESMETKKEIAAIAEEVGKKKRNGITKSWWQFWKW